jgi:hypothetical protein
MGEGEGETAKPRDVVEPDVIRRDGNILYVLNQYRGLTLVDLGEPQIAGFGIPKPKVLAQVPTYGYPRDLYIQDGRAYVMVGYANEYKTDGTKISFSVASKLYVVDIADPAHASVLASFDLNGDLVDSRLVGDVLYAVCAKYEYYWAVADGGVVSSGAGTALKEQTSSSWVASVNIADPANIHKVDEKSFDGLGTLIQATSSAIFVVQQPQWWGWETGQPEPNSIITYVDISDPAGAITIRDQKMNVLGNVADKFKLDVYNDVLRVVSGDWGWNGQRLVHITTFDLTKPDFPVLGKTDLDDAIGETVFATRFDGPRAYIVTYLMKDPLFVADLSDPANPKVVGKLVVPGWSTYIEPQGDRLIALGVDDTNGRRVSCSMFDVSDPANPQLVGDRVSFGDDWSWSSAYNDVKSFTVLSDILIVPFSGWTSSYGGYERLQFISYSESGLAARGYVDVSGQVLRSFAYNGEYYGVTTEQVATINASNLDTPTVVYSTTLAECVADFIELSPGLGAEILTLNDTGEMAVQLVSLEKAMARVEIEIGSFVKAHVAGTKLILVGTDWNVESSQSFYRVAVIDFVVPVLPSVSTFTVDVTPFWGGYYWFGNPGVYYATDGMAADARMSIAPWWRPWDTQESTFIAGGKLVLRCTSAKYDTLFGNATANQGIAIVNLATAEALTVGLGYDQIVSVNAVGRKLIIGTKVGGGIDIGPIPMLGTGAAEPSGKAWLQPTCAYYLQALDVAGLSMGPAVNVPGSFIQYDRGSNVLIVRDDQWDDSGAVISSLRSLSWNEAEVLEPLDDLALPVNVGTIKGAGANVFYDVYDNGYNICAISVDNDGALSAGPKVPVTDQWASLLGAHNAKAYVAIGNAVAVYDFAGTPVLDQLYPSMSYPQTVRFGNDNAYVSFGYSGYAVLPY